jgi:ribulose-5-phosphate 4-epimerase/fuculose-1-phosphate aldolase
MTESAELIATDLVDANRILAHFRLLDAFGHVSARTAPDRFLLSRNLAPALVTYSDLVEYALDSEPVDGGGHHQYLERFIHGELYRHRPEVGAVVHSHSPGLVAMGLLRGLPLKPVWHMAGFIARGAPLFEIRNTAGDGTDLLIRDGRLGASLAAALGSASVVLMRGHGATVVGKDVRQAVYRCLYAEQNAQIQLSASGLGELQYLTPAEAAAAETAVEAQIDRPWRLWRSAALLPASPPGNADA